MSTVTVDFDNTFILLNQIVVIDPNTEYLYQNTGGYMLNIVIADAEPVEGAVGILLMQNDRVRLTSDQNIYINNVASSLGKGQVTIYDTERIVYNFIQDNNNNNIVDNTDIQILGN